MADKKCSAAAPLSVVYDRNVHGVASHPALQSSIPLGACAADERSELNPIDMMAMGLASCLLILMGKTAAAEKLDMTGAKADVSYELQDYRLMSFRVDVQLPKKLAAQDQAKLEAASKACPVYLAIHPDVKVTVNFNWPK
jgi:uncharacterized OsmC-like protein